MIERKLIREALAATLKADAGVSALVTPDNIMKSRIRPTWDDDGTLPAILIYTESETGVVSLEAPLEYERTIQLVIQVVHTLDGGEELNDTLDDICEAIDVAIHKDDTLGLVDGNGDCILKKLRYNNTTTTLEQGTNTIGAINITYDATYYREAPKAGNDGVIDDLLKTHADYDIVEPDGAVDQQDIIETPGP